MEADWDLLAVVRGCTAASTSSPSTAAPTTSPAPEPPLPPAATHHGGGGFSPSGFEELQQIVFSPENQSFSLSTSPLDGAFNHEQPQQIVFQPVISTTTTTMSASSIISIGSVFTPHTHRNSLLCSSTTTTSHTQQRSKKRKNLQKRVCHVGAEGLSSDMWAWRKYGQKPIKGSPYPRGYYRCSSSKGCLARKQVERNRSDPKMFIVTYTSEHNHPMPTHRNSLAGSTRHKPTGEATAAAAAASPGSGSPVVVEKGEIKEGYGDEMEFKDMVMNDDFFVGFEELDDSDGGDFFPDQIQEVEMGCPLVGQQQ